MHKTFQADTDSGFSPPNLESKSSATSAPQFWAEVPLISDSNFYLHFGLSPLGRKFC